MKPEALQERNQDGALTCPDGMYSHPGGTMQRDEAPTGLQMKRSATTNRLATVIAAVAVALGVGAWAAVRSGRRFPAPIPTVVYLLSMDEAGARGLDLASVNLASARGLPGAEAVDEAECLTVLNGWARHVESEVKRNRRRFVENPAYYESSEAKFKMIHPVLALQQDFGVRYDAERIGTPSRADLFDPSFFGDAAGVFICGPLGKRRTGTCASLPVLVVAVGRRLGWPLKLAATKGHLFARWESKNGKERFNIEAAGRGVDFPPDEHYRKWPFPLSAREEAEEGFLKSFSPAEELALCLELRAACLAANGRHAESAEALTAAMRLRPGSTNLRRLAAMEKALAVSGVTGEGGRP